MRFMRRVRGLARSPGCWKAIGVGAAPSRGALGWMPESSGTAAVFASFRLVAGVSLLFASPPVPGLEPVSAGVPIDSA